MHATFLLLPPSSIMPFPSVPSPPTLFPTYLVPSLSFRRRQSSTDSTASAATASSSQSSASRVSTVSTAASSLIAEQDYIPEKETLQDDEAFLTSHTSHLRCARCLADLALSSQIISKGFTGRHGRAYLVAPSSSSAPPPSSRRYLTNPLPNLPNTYTHKPVPRQLVTGAHTVGDLGCAHCGAVLGWKYIAAEDIAQRYKVGKFILEMKRVCRASTWEADGDDDIIKSKPKRLKKSAVPDEEVEFDSQDEDECEDLFLGIWTPHMAAQRRKEKLLERS
ncbi:Hypothetical protein R9X50_00771200 [Acrodontium crateriforme]|uniref:Yippee domain-containing protein n=1 Tax=Acrodontium crateriforme TaxID=150365 RepID=A0AAQ3RCW5_9PEZI|nr:Hypothetical protein R9X50_00771200 [Acrodontium crateriforme]